MKVFFCKNGYRDTKGWGCPFCNNFYTYGMDLSVDESVKRHLTECVAIMPHFTGFDDIELPKEQVPNFRDLKDVLSRRLTRMQRYFLEKEMELIIKGFNNL